MRIAFATALGLATALSGACGGTVVTGTTSTTGTGAGGAGSTATTGTTATTAGTGGSTTGTTTTASTTTGAGGGASDYSAVWLVTNLPRYVIFKREPALDRCVRLTVEMTGGTGFGIQTPASWTVGQAEVTAHASDCALDPGGFPVITQTSVTANGGSGALTHTPAQFPCSVSIHATLTFPPGLPWAPPSDALDADGLQIQGAGCGG